MSRREFRAQRADAPRSDDGEPYLFAFYDLLLSRAEIMQPPMNADELKEPCK
jgi:hypothetical protein